MTQGRFEEQIGWDDLLGPGLTNDPYPALSHLRDEDPVHFNERLDAWILTRYDDVCASFRDPRLSSDRVSPFIARLPQERRAVCEPVLGTLGRWMVFKDPPDHARLRARVAPAFTARAIRSRETRIRRLVTELLDRFVGEDLTDVVSGFAAPLPAIVIAELIGVPEQERERFQLWSDDLALLVFGSVDVEDRYERAARAQAGLRAMFVELADQARRSPPEEGLVSLLVHQDDPLDADELTAMCVLMLFAGHETTTNLIASAVAALLDHPAQAAAIRADDSLGASAVEEFLRFDGPSKVSPRWVVEDLELRGRRIRAGQRVFPMQLAANRDPARFAEPDRLDLERSPNPHVAFGHGLHSCVGAPLARLETRIAVTELVRRFPGLRSAGERVWRPSVLARGLERLPVACG